MSEEASDITACYDAGPWDEVQDSGYAKRIGVRFI